VESEERHCVRRQVRTPGRTRVYIQCMCRHGHAISVLVCNILLTAEVSNNRAHCTTQDSVSGEQCVVHRTMVLGYRFFVNLTTSTSTGYNTICRASVVPHYATVSGGGCSYHTVMTVAYKIPSDLVRIPYDEQESYKDKRAGFIAAVRMTTRYQ
jgi:hypothetical protein